MSSTKKTESLPTWTEYSEKMIAGPQTYEPTGDLTTCQLRNPSSSIKKEMKNARAHSHKPKDDEFQKRELRLMKNREAARVCRRKKKQYITCLENRVAMLENQNKTLMEQLKVLKDMSMKFSDRPLAMGACIKYV